ncbi:MAG: hypothetical protein JST54_17945 [Deltaproteobacteria bacterium]|nr:hypothetical protein [Deltaproteobacteria bacterium]
MSDESEPPRRITLRLPDDHYVNLPMQVSVEGVTSAPVPIGTGITVGSAPQDTISLPSSELRPGHLEIKPAKWGVRLTNLAPEVAETVMFLGGHPVSGTFGDFHGSVVIVVGGVKLSFSCIHPAPTVHPAFEGFVGRSSVMRQFYSRLEALAKLDQPIFLESSSFELRELAAKAIHARSRFARGGFCYLEGAEILDAAERLSAVPVSANAAESAVRPPEDPPREPGGTLFFQALDFCDEQACRHLIRLLDEGWVANKKGSMPERLNVRLLGSFSVRSGFNLRLTEAQKAVVERFQRHILRIPNLRERLEDLGDVVTHLTENSPDGLGVRWSVEAIAELRQNVFGDDFDGLKKTVILALRELDGRAVVTAEDVQRAVARRSGRRPMELDPKLVH